MEYPVLISQAWLCDIEKNMRMTLKEELKKCRANLKRMLSKRDKWIKEHPGQVWTAYKWLTEVLSLGRSSSEVYATHLKSGNE